MFKYFILLVFTLSLLEVSSQSQIDKNKIHKEKIEAGKTKLKIFLNNRLDKLQNTLRNENEKLTDIKDFKFGRLKSEREEQIKDQKKIISSLERYKKRIEKELVKSNMHKTFEFQKEPKKLVKYVFKAMKNENYQKLRHLCDPYMENDSDVNGICLVNILPKDKISRIRDNFKNGRIIGEPKIEQNKANLEIAIGPESKRLEKLKLVKRNDFWYLLSF
jgi:hypothetical protein